MCSRPVCMLDAGQVCGTECIKEDKVFTSDLQVRHLSFLKGKLGVKRTTTYWAVLRECGHKPLQINWFRSVVKLYNSMLKSNSETLSRVLKADLSIHSRDPSCWAWMFQGLRSLVQAVWQVTSIYIHRLRTVWRDVEGLNPQDTNSKLETYQSRFAVPFNHNVGCIPLCLPRHLRLDLSQVETQHVLRIVSRFRLRAHTLKVDSWRQHLGIMNSFLCDRCACEQI
jgi:hypothetical protein